MSVTELSESQVSLLWDGNNMVLLTSQSVYGNIVQWRIWRHLKRENVLLDVWHNYYQWFDKAEVYFSLMNRILLLCYCSTIPKRFPFPHGRSWVISMLSKKWKDNWQNGRTYLQIINLIRGLYLEYIKNTYSPKMRQETQLKISKVFEQTFHIQRGYAKGQ